MKWVKKFCVVVLAAACPLAWAQATAAAAPPISPMPTTAPTGPTGPIAPQAFFSPEQLGDVALSPSGRWLAVAVQPAGLRRGIAVYDLHGQEPPRDIARFSDIDIASMYWVGEERLVFELLDAQRGSGDQRYGQGLFSVKRDGSELNQLVLMQWWHNPGQGTQASRRLDVTHGLVHVPLQQTPGAETVIVSGWRNAQIRERVLKRINIVSGRVQALDVAAPLNVHRWLFDAAGNPVVAQAQSAGRVTVYERVADGQGQLSRDWRVLLEADAIQVPWQLHSLDRLGRLYVTEPTGPGGEEVLKRFDRERKSPQGQAVVAVPGFDFRGYLLQDDGADPLLGVRVLADSETTVWLDAGMAALQKAIDQRLPDRTNTLSCGRCREADRTVVVTSASDRHPGEIWLWRGETARPAVWRRLGVKRPAIDPQRMAELAFTRFAARDGLGIPLWVTLPAPASALAATGPAPAVVLVHGGPWLRGGHWAWHAMPQFLASRGYVVLEPEFRGSRGYGLRHFQAGWRQWGRAMQDDLVDAVEWAAQRGLIDRQRVCIAGGSYGGYAALMGLVRQGDGFRCGVSWMPVADLMGHLREGSPDDWRDEVRSYTLPQLVGDRIRDAEMLREVSPLAQAQRIRAPLLLAWGEEDWRVSPDQAKDLLGALRDAGHQPESVSYKDEGHHWMKESTRLDFARRLEAFLARSLQTPAAAGQP